MDFNKNDLGVYPTLDLFLKNNKIILTEPLRTKFNRFEPKLIGLRRLFVRFGSPVHRPLLSVAGKPIPSSPKTLLCFPKTSKNPTLHFPNTLSFLSSGSSKNTQFLGKKKMNNDSLKIFPPTKQPPQLNVQQAFSNFKTQCSGFLQHLSHFQTSLSSLQDRAKQALEPGFLRSGSFPFPSDKNPVWARIGSNSGTQMNLTRQLGSAMSTEAIEERLAGVPVYALSNSNEQFVLVSGVASGKSLGLLCFKKEDAETLLEQMRGMDPAMGKEGSRVVPVALNKVICSTVCSFLNLPFIFLLSFYIDFE